MQTESINQSSSHSLSIVMYSIHASCTLVVHVAVVSLLVCEFCSRITTGAVRSLITACTPVGLHANCSCLRWIREQCVANTLYCMVLLLHCFAFVYVSLCTHSVRHTVHSLLLSCCGSGSTMAGGMTELHLHLDR
jgi:hypothetical protein